MNYQHCVYLGELSEICTEISLRMDEQAEQHQHQVVSDSQNQLVHKVVECKLCLSSQQRMDEQAKQHQHVVSDLQNQLETLKIEKCVANRSVHSESLNDPCRGSELVTMYRELKTQIWGETKEKMTKLRFEQKQKDRTKELIKEIFEKGKKDVLLKRQEKDRMLKQISGIPNTVQENISPYIQSSMDNLKMFFFLHFQDIKNTSDFKTFVKEEYQCPHEVLHELYVHCYFVSRLMELHDPPIELCWDSPGVDVFPDLLGMNVSH
ncbi:uncharacterized protein LOC116223144 isoform X2 [Clupea harengus]|uniref:Uncharacterized protein LOC116223144 isoform X2 n=1 Tax=Clupea harengus TaxID=7950 RepID=A0A6P8G416_CLUHA|nr:uncharacterized protein LOC116223144 isoform X2 [Clupea harengus]